MELINYFQYNSILILTFFFISLFALILNNITKGKSNKLLFSTYRSSPFNPFTYVRLVGHIFGHSDWSHLSNNFVCILLVGPMIEEKFGTMNLAIMMLITSVIVGLANDLRKGYRVYGASCIVYMFITLSSFVNIQNGKIPLTLILIFLFRVVDEFVDLGKNDGISHSGHIIGAICGCIFGFLYFNEQYHLIEYIQQFITQHVG